MKKIALACMAMVLALVGAVGLTGCGDTAFDSAQEIILVQREAGSGTRSAFEEIFSIKDKVHASASALNTTGAVRTAVFGDKYAIGYVSAASVNDEVKAVKIDGVAYSPENVLSGEYKTARPFLMIMSVNTAMTDMSAQAQDFYKYIMSKQGQKICVDAGLVGAAAADGATGIDYTAPAAALSGTVKITGSTSVQPVMNQLAEAYKKLNSSVTISIDGSGSGDGRTAIDKGIADFGIVSADLSTEQAAKYTPLKIATDGVCIIINKKNPADSLTKAQVQEIFKGTFVTWADVK